MLTLRSASLECIILCRFQSNGGATKVFIAALNGSGFLGESDGK